MSTKIQYLDKTWNFIGGCSPASTGCKNCWACKQACGRLKNHPLYKGLTNNGKWTGEIRLCTDIGRADLLEKPLHWRQPCRIGVQFMGDLFHPSVPFEFIKEIWKVLAFCPQHTGQILTKRPERMLEFVKWLEMKHTYDGCKLMFKGESGAKWQYKPWPLPNLLLGVTAENQEMYEKRWRIAETIPAAKLFISFEPLLSGIKMFDSYKRLPDWVIIGCESGPGARECKTEWVRDLVRQCKAAEVPVFVKQLQKIRISKKDKITRYKTDNIEDFPPDLQLREYHK